MPWFFHGELISIKDLIGIEIVNIISYILFSERRV
jgi:hypothetical protein